MLTALAAAVIGVGPGTSLADTVSQVQAYLAANDLADACSTLDALNHKLSAQAGKAISMAQANALIADVNQIKTVLTC